MEARNPKYNDIGSINLEINHPRYGWIPCTVSPGDKDTKELYDAAVAGDFGDIAPAEIDLNAYKEQLCNQMEAVLPDLFEAGFKYNDCQIQADQVAQQNAYAFLTMATAGTAQYPLIWRTRDNRFMELSDLAAVQNFSVAMISFVQGEYQRIWAAKDQIRAAESIETAEQILENYFDGN